MQYPSQEKFQKHRPHQNPADTAPHMSHSTQGWDAMMEYFQTYYYALGVAFSKKSSMIFFLKQKCILGPKR